MYARTDYLGYIILPHVIAATDNLMIHEIDIWIGILEVDMVDDVY